MREEWKKSLLEMGKILGITLAVYVLLRFLLPLVLPFLFAVFLAKLLHPLVEKLYKKLHLKKGILSGIVLLAFFSLLAAAVWFVGRGFVGQVRALIQNREVYQEKMSDLWYNCCCQMADWTGMEAETLSHDIAGVAPHVWGQLRETLLPALIDGSFSWAKGIFVIVGILVVVGVSALLILKEYNGLYQALEQNGLGRLALNVSRRVYHAGGGYLKAQLLILLVVSGICTVGLFFAGNSYALLAGVGIGFCDALPFLGTGTIFIPWAILELLQGKYWMAAVYAVIYTIASLTRELLEPKLLGNKLGMPPLTVIVSVYMGICVYGLWGFALGPLSYILIREIRLELKGA